MIRVGITGGIGSGKSYISHILAERYGIPVYNCDVEAKRLNVESEEIRSQLTALLGPQVYDSQGQLRRDVLASYLFQGPENAARIDAIIHPVVKNDFKEWCQATARQQNERHPYHGILAMECAILFESGFDELADVTINVSAPAQLRKQRASQRDGVAPESIERRMALQMDDSVRSQRANYTIENDGRDVITQIEHILHDITQPQP